MFTFLILSISLSLNAQKVPSKFKQYFKKNIDKRSFGEKFSNKLGRSTLDAGRSFALVCGISDYPKMNSSNKELKPAAEDVKMIVSYLKNIEQFDEIVVLEDSHVTHENLEYFIRDYFAKRIKRFPKSRFLFTYSGHGMTQNAQGFLLKSSARNLNDKENSINLSVLKLYINDVITSAHHTLVLLNSCYSGSFLKRSFGENILIPKNPGAHAITAGGSAELSWHYPELGKGSVFFEKTIAGLEGVADNNLNGIITSFELASYLRNEIQSSTDQDQNPHFGDISSNGSSGEFFFFNKNLLQESKSKEIIDDDKRKSFGNLAQNLLIQGTSKKKEGDFESAVGLLKLSADLGHPEAMKMLKEMYSSGDGVFKDLEEAELWDNKIKKYNLPPRALWFTLGAGLSTQKWAGVGELSLQKGPNLYSARAGRLSSDIDFNQNGFWEYGLLYGRATQSRFAHLSFSVGPSYIVKDTDIETSFLDSSNIGIAWGFQAFLNRSYLSLGIYAYGNVLGDSSYGALTFAIQIGKLR